MRYKNYSNHTQRPPRGKVPGLAAPQRRGGPGGQHVQTVSEPTSHLPEDAAGAPPAIPNTVYMNLSGRAIHPAHPFTLTHRRTLVDSRTPCDGRTDSQPPGLRYYRFSAPIEYQKTQRLMPGVVVVLQGRKTATLQGRKHSYDAMHHLVLGREALCQGTVVSASAEAPYHLMASGMWDQLATHLAKPPVSHHCAELASVA